MIEDRQTETNPQVIFSWTAPLRPYKKRSGTVLRFYLAVAFLLSVIIVFFGDKVLLLPIWALLFLFYILTITPPPNVENKITKFGIQTSNTTFHWDSLSYFYFTKKFGFYILTLVTHPPVNYHAYLVVPDIETKETVLALLTDHIVYIESPKKSITEKLIDLFCLLIPEEKEENEEPTQKKTSSDDSDHQAVSSTPKEEPPARQTSEPSI